MRTRRPSSRPNPDRAERTAPQRQATPTSASAGVEQIAEVGSSTPTLDGLDSAQGTRPPGLVLSDTLRSGAKGSEVRELQAFLGIETDGTFGPATQDAIEAWQAANGLEPDGVVGPATLARLATGATSVDVNSTLRPGAKGADVQRLQRFLGLEPDGKFGPDTEAAVRAFQRSKGLTADGVAGPDTRAALAGREQEAPAPTQETAPEQTPSSPQRPRPDSSSEQPGRPAGELASPWHSDTSFVPKYASTAYSESGSYRKKSDPYAVGAITRPTRDQDLGGKTYGAYQFDSRVYRDGTNQSDKARDNSTAMRFVRDPDNPYGPRLAAIVRRHGLASSQFDQAWGEITAEDNKAFGKAQEVFMEKENKSKVDGFLSKVGASAEVAKDPRIRDLIIGTYNQYDSLTNGIIAHVKAANRDGSMSADELGLLIQDYKGDRVTSHFKSSPKAHKGIRNRIKRERGMFE